VGHKETGFTSPTTNDQVKLLLKRAKSARVERPQQKAAITRDILDKMLGTCDNTLIGVRDRALLLVAFCSGGRRRSEIANLTTNDITKTNDGYLIILAKSKTDQNADGFSVRIAGESALALKQWLLKSGIRQGYLFRGIKSDLTLYDSITGNSIYKIVKKRIKLIGLDETLYGAHSLRAGFITDSVNSGKTIYEVMQYSGHKDTETAQSYIRLK
jgi:integrase